MTIKVVEKKFDGVHLSIALNGDYSVVMPGFKLRHCRSGLLCSGNGELVENFRDDRPVAITKGVIRAGFPPRSCVFAAIEPKPSGH